MKKPYFCINCNNPICYTNYLYGSKKCRHCSLLIFPIIKKELIDLYINQKLSISKIAKIFTISDTTVYNCLLKYNVRIKTRRESHLGKKRPEHSKRMMGKNNPMYGKKRTKLECKKIRLGRLGKYRGKYHPCYGKKFPEHSKRMKQNWKDKEFRNLMIKNSLNSRNIFPNKKEIELNQLLNKLFYKEYFYVGDGKVVINGFNPDFINVNGQKKIIEFNGEYWHRNTQKKDKRKLRTYKKYGYKTLVVWQKELSDYKKLTNKLIKFHNIGVKI